MNGYIELASAVNDDSLLRLRHPMQCSRQVFADKLKRSRSHLSKLEKGHVSVSEKIAHYFQILAEQHPETNRSSNVRAVPLRSMAETGAGIDYEELPISLQDSVPIDCLDRNAFAIEINGDSMDPKYYKGDLVVIPEQKPYNGTLVVARLASEGVVFKLFSKREDQVTLSSYNPAYPPIMVDPDSVHWAFPVWQVIRI